MTGRDLKFLNAYQVAEKKGQNLQDILKKAKNKDSSFMEQLFLIKQGYDVGTAVSDETSYSSNPKDHNSNDWETKFHPLFGWCHHFEPEFLLKASLNKTIVEFVNFHVDYKKAYMDKPKRFQVHDTGKFEDVRNDDNQTLIIIVYHKGAFYHSQILQPIGLTENNRFNVEQEIIDKTKTKEIFNCKDEYEYHEDECLGNCLVSRFIQGSIAKKSTSHT